MMRGGGRSAVAPAHTPDRAIVSPARRRSPQRDGFGCGEGLLSYPAATHRDQRAGPATLQR